MRRLLNPRMVVSITMLPIGVLGLIQINPWVQHRYDDRGFGVTTVQ